MCVDWRYHGAKPQTTDARVVQKTGETGDLTGATGELIGEMGELPRGSAAQQHPAAVWLVASGFAASAFAHESSLGWGLGLQPLGRLGLPALHLSSVLVNALQGLITTGRASANQPGAMLKEAADCTLLLRTQACGPYTG